MGVAAGWEGTWVDEPPCWLDELLPPSGLPTGLSGPLEDDALLGGGLEDEGLVGLGVAEEEAVEVTVAEEEAGGGRVLVLLSMLRFCATCWLEELVVETGVEVWYPPR